MIIKLMKFFFLYFYAGVNYRVKINIKLILFLKKNNFIKVASYFSNNMQKNMEFLFHRMQSLILVYV